MIVKYKMACDKCEKKLDVTIECNPFMSDIFIPQDLSEIKCNCRK